MPKDIMEVLPTPEMLDGEKVEKEDIKGKKLVISDYVLLSSSYEGKGNFVIVQALCENKTVTFSAGDVVTKKLESIGKDKLPITAKLVLTKGKAGRSYWDLASAK